MERKIFYSAATILAALGLVGGVLAVSGTSLHPSLFTTSMSLVLLRIVLARIIATGPHAAIQGGGLAPEAERASFEAISRSLGDLSRRLEQPVENPHALLEKVETVLARDIPALLSHTKGLGEVASRQEKARLVSHISETERYLNRAWSAMTDGYEEEAREALKAARERSGETLSLLHSFQKKEPPTVFSHDGRPA
jgi:hypothetical protein